MELNDAMAMELLAALDGIAVRAKADVTEGQRRNASLSLGVGSDDYETWDDVYQAMSTKEAGVQARTGWGEKSQISATSLLEQANSVSATGENSTAVGSRAGYRVTVKDTTVVASGGAVTEQIVADSQQISTAFQRDARRYAP